MSRRKEIAVEAVKTCIMAAFYFSWGAFAYWNDGKRGVIGGLAAIAIAGVIGWGVCTFIEKE